MSYSDWTEYMSEESSPCDELMLYVLSRIHCRHTVVYTANRVWTTVHADGKTTVDDLMSICDLRLVYLGGKTFGELKKLPMCAPPLPQVRQTPVKKSANKARKGKVPTKPLTLSIKSPKDKGKSQPRRNAPGGALIERRTSTSVTATVLKEAPSLSQDEPSTNSGKTQSEPLPFISSQCLNSSNIETSVADAPSGKSPKPLLEGEQITAANRVNTPPCLNSSNIVSSAADVPLVTPPAPLVTEDKEVRSPIAVDADGYSPCHTNKQSGMCLNSSSNIPLLSSKSPESLCTLVRSHLISNMSLYNSEINKFVIARAKPATEERSPSLKTIVTDYIHKRHPNIDLDDTLTDVLKFNILRKYEIRNQDAAPELDLNVLLKNLALKRKSEVIVPKLDKVTLHRWTKKVPHWSELDLYSDLEDQCDSVITDRPINRDNGVHFTMIGGHVLRKRKRQRSNSNT